MRTVNGLILGEARPANAELLTAFNRLADEFRRLQVLVEQRFGPESGEPESTAIAVVGIVSEVFGVTREDIMGRHRMTQITWARFAAIFETYQVSGAGVNAVGRAFGRHHGTVCNAIKQIRQAGDKGPPGVVAKLQLVSDRLMGLGPRSGGRS